MRGLNEALEHAKGGDVPGLKVYVPAQMDVRAIRKQVGLSQNAFAATIGVQVGTLRNWEQGRRQPEGPARVLLALLERNPRIVAEVLGSREGTQGGAQRTLAPTPAKRQVHSAGAGPNTRTLPKATASRATPKPQI
jgi:putative transcriptional regulator